MLIKSLAPAVCFTILTTSLLVPIRALAADIDAKPNHKELSNSEWERKVYFAFNSAQLDEYAIDDINKFLSQLKKDQHAQFDIQIMGNTDAVGSSEANAKLAKKRALAVKNFIESKGISVANWRVGVNGEGQPIGSNETARGRQENRRVDLMIRLSRGAEIARSTE